MKYQLIDANPDDFTYLYNTSAFTIEGLTTDEESMNQLIEMLSRYGVRENPEIYVVKGSLMNRYYNLIKDPYKDELNIVAIPTTQFKDVSKLAIFKMKIGARWFDDIVDNNRMHENGNI